ncbi:MAG TPA: ribosome recycling factor [Patescibacteria group bacterium]|nr:ribosome recycling factor [Patescibacteria group bacterium]
MNLDTARLQMGKIIEILKSDLGTVRTGRATPSLVENIVINAYGGTQKLRVMELATIGTSDSQTIIITPFDASIIEEIQKGIMETNVGLNPVVDGQLIRISIPLLSGERRAELVALVNQKLEGGRIQVRQVRHEAMDTVKKQFNNKEIGEDDVLRLEKEIQNLTDETIKTIDELGKKKEEELMQL